jgi:Domain of unknown function (DUF4037)
MAGELTPGLALCRAFYGEAVEPVLRAHFPSLAHAAGLIGPGSEVLGFDTARSQDHHFGPRALLFLRDDDLPLSPRVSECLAAHLPHAFRGFSTNFTEPQADGSRMPAPTATGRVNHLIEIHSVRSYARARMGLDPGELSSLRRWLTLPQQRLLEFTRGEIFRDDLGEITALREALAYFPHEVWIYLLGCQWQKISQEEAFVGRTNEVGDALGSRLVAARLVRELMRLCFLMERRYWPYTKWFGSTFARLEIAPALAPAFTKALAADDFAAREAALSTAYEVLARRHNALGIAPPLEATVRPYFTRPFMVIAADRFARAIRAAIADPDLKRLPLYGAIDQFTDNTDVAESVAAMTALGAIYGSEDA